MKKIIFYTSVSKKIGFGHLIRDSVLAEQFKKRGFECFLIIDNNYTSLELIKKKIFSKILVIPWTNQKQTAAKLIKMYTKLNCDYLVIDHIMVKQIFQKDILKKNIKWLQFDNSKKIKFYGNQVLNQNLNCNFRKKSGQKQYCGNKYIILRSQFYKKKTTKVKDSSDVFICLGGGENFHKLKYIYEMLNVLKLLNKLHFIINDNNTYYKFDKLINKHSNNLNIKIHFKKKNLAKIMDKCKFSINTSGMISHELNSRNVSMMLFSLVKNQENILNEWKKMGHCVLGKLLKKNKVSHFKKIQKILKKNEKLKKSNSSNKILGINEIINDSIQIIKENKSKN